MPACPLPATSIVLASTVAETGRLHAWLDGSLADGSLPDRTAHAIRLCLEEAVMNVVLHGYGPGGPGAIDVALWSEPGAVFARVADSAGAFDPTAARPPAAKQELAAGPPGGRGLGLIRSFAAAAQYERLDGQNRLSLEFSVPSSEPGASLR